LVRAFTSSAECVYEYQHEETLWMRPSNIRPFMDRMDFIFLNSTYLTLRIQQRTFSYSNLGIRHGSIISTLFATYSKSIVAPVVFQRVFVSHRSQYSRYSAIYTEWFETQITLAVES
ncbi:hypothetical protein TNCV_3124141, partial [Trichonephila clavipes]